MVPKKPGWKKMVPSPGRSTMSAGDWWLARVQRGGTMQKKPYNIIGAKRVFPMRHERDAEIEGGGEGRAPRQNPKVSFATPKIDPSLESPPLDSSPDFQHSNPRADVSVCEATASIDPGKCVRRAASVPFLGAPGIARSGDLASTISMPRHELRSLPVSYVWGASRGFPSREPGVPPAANGARRPVRS
ncbi:hypothetical protein NL676_004223 [Syzygium grande]|nr:hypothetical protein NL676_004223 [Syzygium grande]